MALVMGVAELEEVTYQTLFALPKFTGISMPAALSRVSRVRSPPQVFFLCSSCFPSFKSRKLTSGWTSWIRSSPLSW